MEINVNQIILDKDQSSKTLIDYLSQCQDDLNIQDAYIYHNFPLYREDDDTSSKANVMLISPFHGIVIFQTSDLSSRSDNIVEKVTSLKDKLEQVYSQIYAKLIRNKSIRKSPVELKINITQSIFLPNSEKSLLEQENIDDFVSLIYEARELNSLFNERKLTEKIEETLYKEVIATVEGSKGIIKPKERKISARTEDEEKTKGSILQSLELEIANFDRDQKRAALNIINGPQRIRGLAGSGKTIILTWKAALIHLNFPDAQILYTFYTKSLYDLIKRLITRFYREYSDQDPNWEKIDILHAWGGQNVPGVYYKTCLENGIQPKSFSEARNVSANPFDYVCNDLLKYDLKEIYDYTLIDEGQDFESSFYKLCLKLTKDKKLTWGYDECQNILDIDIQDTKQTFGIDSHGNYLVNFSDTPEGVQNDIVLHVCYRNPLEIIFYAFALGLGLYNEPILQMPENNEHWQDLGFQIEEGQSREDDFMKIYRPKENSPLNFHKYSKNEEPISVRIFNDEAENPNDFIQECEYVAKCIKNDIDNELLPEDILVVSLDDRYSKSYFTNIGNILKDYNIKCFNLINAPFLNTSFTLKEHVTLSTVYRAKGNEAASVYVVGIDSVFNTKDSIKSRNKIFTAMTRSKAWLTITGVGKYAQLFLDEYTKAKEKYPYFEFIMPNRNSLKSFQRDLDAQQAAMLQLETMAKRTAKQLGIPVEEVIRSLLNKGKK